MISCAGEGKTRSDCNVKNKRSRVVLSIGPHARLPRLSMPSADSMPCVQISNEGRPRHVHRALQRLSPAQPSAIQLQRS